MKEPLNVKLEADKVYAAISEGVSDAMWRMMTNATSAPCEDFYASIEKGTKEALEKVAMNTNKES